MLDQRVVDRPDGVVIVGLDHRGQTDIVDLGAERRRPTIDAQIRHRPSVLTVSVSG